ncbi:unnamed protein product [Sphagnum troendelagicum]|uniref:DEAD-box ATP-dependent RNA helicase 13 n=1 Tax=Sphagnum troendelagicum TaxID=128251 RepID=A0ABP0UHS2_9BRYO
MEGGERRNKFSGKRKRGGSGGEQKKVARRWDSGLAWKDVTPSESVSLLLGSDEGGFMSLEEVDCSAFEGSDGNLLVSTLNVNDEPSELFANKKKRKKKGIKAPSSNSVNDETLVDNTLTAFRKKTPSKSALSSKGSDDKGLLEVDPSPPHLDEEPGRPKKGKIQKNQHASRLEDCMESLKDDALQETIGTDVADREAIDMSSWAELRIHPLLLKALSALGFREPTPIQKACIPAAAHQGKDVIGAAETGSGKTLAFSIPILQRLLDEQDKVLRQTDYSCESEEISGQMKKHSGTGSPLRALIITPTRELALQVCEHVRAAAKFTSIKVVPIVGGMAAQKQQRLLKQQPHIVVGTPGRLWELMSGGESHLLELSLLSFFVLDEADRMVEKGHFQELQSIIDMLPSTNRKLHSHSLVQASTAPNGKLPRHESESDDREAPTHREEGVEEMPVDGVQFGSDIHEPQNETLKKKRQTLVFSATLALPPGFKKKLKRGFLGDNGVSKKNEYSVASLSERAGVSHQAAIIDLTTRTVVAKKLEESVIECREEEKDAYLYYVLKVHGCGRTLVFCTSIAALRRVSALLRLLQVPVWPLHAQMQQKQRLKAMDRFKSSEDCVMVATDVAARGLDVEGIRTVIHYQLPHSAEMYVHRSGRTARADTDGCSIALISPADRSKYSTLCRALSKAKGLSAFPVDVTYMPAVQRRVSLACEVDKVLRKHSQSKAELSWLTRHAEALEIKLQNSDEDEMGPSSSKKSGLVEVQKLQQDLHNLLKQPLEPKAFSRRYITGSGISPLLAKQLKEYTATKASKVGMHLSNNSGKQGRLVVIGQEAMEPLDALRKSTSHPASLENVIRSKRRRGK